MTPQHVTSLDTLIAALHRTEPPPDRLAELRGLLAVMDEKAAAENSDEVRRTLLAAYWLIPTDRDWPRGDVVKVTLSDDGGIWACVDLVAEGKRLAKLIGAGVWKRITGNR